MGLDPATTWEVATISVRRRAEGVGPVWTAALLHGLLELTRVNRATAVVAVLDEGPAPCSAVPASPSSRFPGCEPRPYCGSPSSTPVWTDLDAMRRRQRLTQPESYRLVTLGPGLHGVELPDADAFRLDEQVLDLRPAASRLRAG